MISRLVSLWGGRRATIATVISFISVLLLTLASYPVYAGPGGLVSVNGRKGMHKGCASRIDDMGSWWTSSPFWSVGVYIGGANRGCENVNLTRDWVSRVYDQGWNFMPIWVGPQAPCSGFKTKISTNTQTARTQGTNDATAAFNAATNLGFTKGTIIYFDIEGYNTSDSTCRNAVNAFLGAWVEKMHALGNRTGIYGSSCGSAASDWASINRVPDDVWLAATVNDPNFTPTVLDIPCVDNGLWVFSQRIRHYRANSTETFGGIQLTIDRDCLQGHVAGGREYDDALPNVCNI